MGAAGVSPRWPAPLLLHPPPALGEELGQGLVERHAVVDGREVGPDVLAPLLLFLIWALDAAKSGGMLPSPCHLAGAARPPEDFRAP
jgi:hypothetical protein